MAIEGFTRVPNAVVTLPGLYPGARAVLTILHHFVGDDGDWCELDNLRVAEIGELLGAERRTVWKYLGELGERDLIEIARDRAGGWGIRLLEPPHTTPDAPPAIDPLARKLPAPRVLTARQRAIGRERRKVRGRRLAIAARDGWLCGICGQPITDRNDLHIDHVHPVSKGGLSTDDNLRPTHWRCNVLKGAR
jgi:hypothetical protein